MSEYSKAYASRVKNGKAQIHIKPSHEGKFHEAVGKSEDKPITEADIQKGKHSSNPTTRKESTFAENARHWHKG